jgi:hypothetical protein
MATCEHGHVCVEGGQIGWKGAGSRSRGCRTPINGVRGPLEPPTHWEGSPRGRVTQTRLLACLQDKQAVALRSYPDEAHNQALRLHTMRNAQPFRHLHEHGVDSAAALFGHRLHRCRHLHTDAPVNEVASHSHLPFSSEKTQCSPHCGNALIAARTVRWALECEPWEAYRQAAWAHERV